MGATFEDQERRVAMFLLSNMRGTEDSRRVERPRPPRNMTYIDLKEVPKRFCLQCTASSDSRALV